MAPTPTPLTSHTRAILDSARGEMANHHFSNKQMHELRPDEHNYVPVTLWYSAEGVILGTGDQEPPGLEKRLLHPNDLRSITMCADENGLSIRVFNPHVNGGDGRVWYAGGGAEARYVNGLEEVPNEQMLLRTMILPQISRYRQSFPEHDELPRVLTLHPDDIRQRLREQEMMRHEQQAKRVVSEAYGVMDSHAQEILDAQRAKHGQPSVYARGRQTRDDAPAPNALDDIRWMWAGLCAYLKSINPLRRYYKK